MPFLGKMPPYDYIVSPYVSMHRKLIKMVSDVSQRNCVYLILKFSLEKNDTTFVLVTKLERWGIRRLRYKDGDRKPLR